MADILVAHSSQPCAERQALIDQIRNAIALTLSIHNEEFEDVIGEGRPSGLPYADRLREAREHRAFLIEQLGHHVGEHGCGNNPAPYS